MYRKSDLSCRNRKPQLVLYQFYGLPRYIPAAPRVVRCFIRTVSRGAAGTLGKQFGSVHLLAPDT